MAAYYNNGWEYLYKEYRDGTERIRLTCSFIGEFWIDYDYDGSCPTLCGSFETEEEAVKTLMKHRPNAQFYSACK